MDAQTIFILAVLAIPITALILMQVFSRSKEMTAAATVVSRRLELGIGGGAYGDNWNRLVTFRLSDGEELELFAIRQDYEALTEGLSGQVTWQKENLLHFHPDNE